LQSPYIRLLPKGRCTQSWSTQKHKHHVLSGRHPQPRLFLTRAGILYVKHSQAEQLLLPSFRWSPEELATLLRAVDHSDYGYGTLGECLDVLLYEDPNIVRKLHIAITLLLKDPDTAQAVRAATLSLAHARDRRKQLALLIADYPALMEHEWFRDNAAAIEESAERFSLY
jgi:hypothetical protein